MSQYGKKRLSNQKRTSYRRKSARVIKNRRRRGRKKI